MTKPKPKHLHLKDGRPTSYDDAKVARVIEHVADGDFLSVACKRVGVPISTFYMWMDEKPLLLEAYAYARRSQSQQILGKMMSYLAEGSDATMPAVSKSKNIADKLQWYLSVNCKDFRRDKTGRDELDETVISEWSGTKSIADSMSWIRLYVGEGRLSLEGARKYIDILKGEAELTELKEILARLKNVEELAAKK
jgi:hypothetical protein